MSMKVILREDGILHYDGLLFKVKWDVHARHLPSVGHPVMVERVVAYKDMYPTKRLILYRYPLKVELLGWAEADVREVRAK